MIKWYWWWGFICVGHMVWASEGRKRLSQQVQRPSRQKSGSGFIMIVLLQDGMGMIAISSDSYVLSEFYGCCICWWRAKKHGWQCHYGIIDRAVHLLPPLHRDSWPCHFLFWPWQHVSQKKMVLPSQTCRWRAKNHSQSSLAHLLQISLWPCSWLWNCTQI